MPGQLGRDKEGCYSRWGNEGKKYYYECGNEEERNKAKEKAYKQGIAIGDYELETYNDYPQSASENACRALRWVEENGWGSCGENTGKQRAHQLCNRENISRDTIARMASFKRHQQHKDVPYDEGCGGLMWDSWGGDEGINWGQRKLDQIEKMEKINSFQELQRRVKIGFDYDDTLTKYKIRDLVKELIKAGGTEVYIVSARSQSFELYRIAQMLGIPQYRVFMMGSNEKKIEKIKELGLEKFFDNNPDVIRELPNVGELIR